MISPETGFVEYNQGYLRRGSVFQLSDGKRAVAFNGFHLGGETVEQSTAIQAIVMGKDCITDVSESFLWVISDTGMQANQNTVKIHPEYVCKPALVDEPVCLLQLFRPHGNEQGVRGII